MSFCSINYNALERKQIKKLINKLTEISHVISFSFFPLLYFISSSVGNALWVTRSVDTVWLRSGSSWMDTVTRSCAVRSASLSEAVILAFVEIKRFGSFATCLNLSRHRVRSECFDIGMRRRIYATQIVACVKYPFKVRSITNLVDLVQLIVFRFVNTALIKLSLG